MKQGVIITGGSIEPEFALSFLAKCGKIDLLIAADRGLVFCKTHGIVPNCIVGDFDSAGTAILEDYRDDLSIEIRSFVPEKDWTDTEIAVETAIEKLKETNEPDAAQEIRIYLLGGTGTRLDHVLGNLQVMELALSKGVSLVIVNAHNEIRMIGGTAGGYLEIDRAESFGKYLSLVPWGGPVEGLTLTGMKYPLDQFTLPTAGSRGISNEITASKAVISLTAGKLLVIGSCD